MGLADGSVPALGNAAGQESVTGITATAMAWRKSTQCSTEACVEVADLPDGGVAVRHSGQPISAPVLRFSAQEWQAFISGVYAGEFG